MSTNWQTISSLATAGGTLVLASATFAAIRSSNRSARLAEEALLAGMRPLIVTSLAGDPPHKLLWQDRHTAHLEGGRAICEEGNGNGVIYLAMGLRNVGSGIALLHGWRVDPVRVFGEQDVPEVADFRRQGLDLYVASGGSGYWEAAVRDEADPLREALTTRIAEREPIGVDLLYGDQLGGQRTISRFTVLPMGDGGWYCQVARHWHLDRPDPR
ncbi:MAG TPA: hypothetical protein VL961_11775 [Acidimicrobiales bacterium]|nr:hypothetical protein [Acidimicrobiales bacterium]